MKDTKLSYKRILGLIIGTFFSLSAHASMLYAVDQSSMADGILFSIDPSSGNKNEIGSLGTEFQFGGLAYDKNKDTMYMLGGRNNNALYSVDYKNTGAASLIGYHNVDDLFGLAYDSKNNVLYGSQWHGGSGLYILNPSNGSSTQVYTAMDQELGGLAYDSSRDKLIGAGWHDDGNLPLDGQLYEVDRNIQPIFNSFVFGNDSGLAYDYDQDRFYNLGLDGTLLSINPNNGQATTIDTNIGRFDGLAYVGTTIPVPAAAWLFGSALVGVCVVRRKK